MMNTDLVPKLDEERIEFLRKSFFAAEMKRQINDNFVPPHENWVLIKWELCKIGMIQKHQFIKKGLPCPIPMKRVRRYNNKS